MSFILLAKLRVICISLSLVSDIALDFIRYQEKRLASDDAERETVSEQLNIQTFYKILSEEL